MFARTMLASLPSFVGTSPLSFSFENSAMKAYPSIKQFRADRHADFVGHTFAKHDGSNLRFEWDRKQGWFRFGSRRRLLERDHPGFGKSMMMFESGFAETFERFATKSKYDSIVVYCEFWGPKSFAGEHEPDDDHVLTPIDVAIYKKGLLATDSFIEQFGDKFDLGYLGERAWDTQFVDAVRASTLEGMSFEGVVGKAGSGHKRKALKLKSKAWVEKVIQRYGEEKGQKIIAS